ncbi:MAG: single-stranded DNA-binding protein [Dysgonamonadaceae bacterium]|nr:single-stranded DNA-binding protein [Dysgonamonadaceae bacterium]MDD4727392.1 single-stranded DNA-binding protein [Dysgonamonadaceae bacterium]
MSVNKVILLGNVGKDPEVKYFDNDRAVANFSLATTERGFKAANGTEVPERTEWHNISCWGGLAKIVEQYVKKGDPLYIEGKIRTRSYDDKNGVKKYITEINADNLEMLGRRSGSSSQPSDNSSSVSQQASGPAPTAEISEDSDDLPF